MDFVKGVHLMLKSIIRNSIFSIVLLMTIGSMANASTHEMIPNIDDQKIVDFEYFERKQDRCLEAFSRSEFELAFAICTPLAKIGFRDAQLVTGLLYAYGEGTDKNLQRAKIWLMEALKNGREDAAQALSEFGMD